MEEIKFKEVNLYDFGNEVQISGVVWSGKGLQFVTLVPEKSETFDNLKVMPLTLPDWETLLKQTDILETEIFSKDPSGVTKVLLRKSQRQIDSYLQWAVFKRDNYTCRYCGRTGIPLTVDHIDLWEDGGATIEENLLAACKTCNKDRGRTPYRDWLESAKYMQKSKGLTQEQMEANSEIIDRLDDLKAKRVQNVRSR